MKFAFVPFLYMAMTDPQQQQSNNRAATLRPFTMTDTSTARNQSLQSRTDDMNQLANAGAPLSTEELDDILNSLQNVYPADSTPKIDFESLKRTLSQVAHVSHKDWTVTDQNAQLLKSIVLKDGIHESAAARQWLERILVEGNWDGAVEHTRNTGNNSSKPWAVLVTGVNGIRKTTSLYQDWWPQLLQEALVAPPPAGTAEENGNKRKNPPVDLPIESLPSGTNSFFRQLDHMIATLCNEDFKALYVLTQQELHGEPSPALVSKYSNLKAAIFTRYRTLSELLGAVLLKEAQTLDINCMMETSGRDVAMFHYVDHMFESQQYNKLALHFTINDLSQAKTSVDRRMVQEIKDGILAVEAKDHVQIIHANAGGPYGSDVLAGVQEASDAVWNDVVLKGGGVGEDWYKATIAIQAYADKPWTAQAVKPDGSLGTVFTFVQQK